MKLKHLKFFKDYKINELIHHNLNQKLLNKYFIMYKKDIWFFTEAEYEDVYMK
jgi:hypothetical protein